MPFKNELPDSVLLSRVRSRKDADVRSPYYRDTTEAFKASFNFDAKAPALDRAEANRRKNRKNKLKGELEELMKQVDELDLKIAEVNALMNLHENYSNAQKITELVKEKQNLENRKNDLELLWISKSEEYETEFGE